MESKANYGVSVVAVDVRFLVNVAYVRYIEVIQKMLQSLKKRLFKKTFLNNCYASDLSTSKKLVKNYVSVAIITIV
ncbi:MAG: hypothetical protein RL094_40 [Candidatus Parcubacteria bacterium]